MIEQPLNQQFAQQNRQLLNYLSRWDLRLRLSQLALWVPRGIIAGLIASIILAFIAWMRPLLFPSQLAMLAAIFVSAGIVIATIVVMVWPRSTLEKARYFDSLFGLKERSSTALELTSGKIRAPQSLLTHQIQDAVKWAGQVRPSDYLRLQFRRLELILVAVLVIVLAIFLLLYNPQNAILDQQQAVNNAINQQVAQLEQIQQDIQKNGNLTDQEKKQLNQIIQDTVDQLKQPNITQPEAVAALSNAQQKLNQASQQLTQDQQQAMKNAGDNLGASQATQGVGQKLQNGDLSGAANELKNLGQKTGDNQLTDQQKSETADALDKAAKDLEGMNPEAADALRRAADALRNGDSAAAQKAMQEAADALQNQQNKMSQSAQTQAAKSAAQAAQQGQQQVAQAGQQGQSGQSQQGQQSQQGSQSSQNGQNGQNQNGQPSNSQQQNQQGQQGNNQQSGSQQSGQNQQGQQGNNQQGGSQQGQQGQQNQQGQQQGQQSGQQSGSGQQGDQSNGQNSQAGNQQSGNQSSDGQTGQGQAGNDQTGGGQQGGQQSGGQNGTDNSSQTSGSQVGQSSGQGSGQGEGGAGNDITSGSASNNTGGNNTNNGNGNGQVKPYEGVFAPSFIGGNGGQKLQPDGNSPNNGKDPLQQGDFSNNPTGESVVPLNSVVDQAAAQADRAMDINKVPGSLRGVIRNYFTGLQAQ